MDAHFYPYQTYQINQSDVYSWGWNSSDSKVKPLPLPLEINRKSYSSQSGKILLSCIDGPPFPYKLDLGQMPANMSVQHLNTLELLSALPKSLDLTLSPYHHDFGRKILDKMIAAFPNVLIDYKTRGSFRYLGYNLIVHNYLGTSYLESIGLNIPTICLFEPKFYQFTDESLPISIPWSELVFCSLTHLMLHDSLVT